MTGQKHYKSFKNKEKHKTRNGKGAKEKGQSPSYYVGQLGWILRGMNLKYQREYQFTEDRRWRFDFVIGETKEEVEKIKIAIEYHGATGKGGRFSDAGHTSRYGFSDDREKINEAQISGWIVLEFTELFFKHEYQPGQRETMVEGMIEKALQSRYGN